jgi:glutamate racemase
MGCTHYPFAIPLIEEIAGPTVQVIDPAPAVARQVARLLSSAGLLAESSANCRPAEILRFYTTGGPHRLLGILPTLLEEQYPVQAAQWQYGILT